MTPDAPEGPCPEGVPDRFGPIARVYDVVDVPFRFFARNPRAAVSEAIPEDALSILDLGTGTGSVLIALARSHPDASLTGLDASPGMLAVAQSKLARLRDRGIPCADCRFR